MENQANLNEDDDRQGSAYISTAPPRFGQIGDFWKRYDDLASRTDREMSKELNGNLDVLLIFAGLFSTIITTFISLTMPSLSPNPSSEVIDLLRYLVLRDAGNITASLPSIATNSYFSPPQCAVTVAALLYVSLCCSLLAAVGAMFGKEWLQSFDRSSQRGTSEEQSRFRQHKFSGAQRWRLESTVQFLPYLLLLSVIFFFTGVSIFLLPINKTVGGTVIAFFALAAVIYVMIIAAGAISSSWPYQSAASRALRLIVELAGLGSPPDSIASDLDDVRNGLRIGRGRTPNAPLTNNKVRAKTNAQVACWFLEMTSDMSEHLIAAQNICCLNDPACDFMLQDPNTWKQLLWLTSKALRGWQEWPTEENRKTAESFGSAVCHLILRLPRDNTRWLEVQKAFPQELFRSRQGTKLFQLQYVISNGQSDIPPASNTNYDIKKLILRTWVVGRKFPGWRLLSQVVQEQYDDAILSLIALSLAWNFGVRADHGPATFPDSHERRSRAWESYMGGRLNDNLEMAFLCGVTAFNWAEAGGMQPEIAEIYTTFMRRAGPLKFNNSLIDMMMNVRMPSSPVDAREALYWMESATAIGLFIPRDDTRSLVQHPNTIEAIWRALGSVVLAKGAFSEDSGISPIDFVVAGFESLLRYTDGTVHLKDITCYPELVTFIISSLNNETDSQKERWEVVIYGHLSRWLRPEETTVPDLWADQGLSMLIVQRSRQAKNCIEWLDFIEPVRDFASSSPPWSRMLFRDGFIEAVGDALLCLHGDGTSVEGNSNREVMELFALRVILDIWSQGAGGAGDALTAEGLLPLVGRFFGLVDKFLNAELDSTTLNTNAAENTIQGTGQIRIGSQLPRFLSLAFTFTELVQFVDNIRSRWTLSAFVSRNTDVAVNRLLGTSEGSPLYHWDYDLYCESGSSIACVRDGYLHDTLL